MNHLGGHMNKTHVDRGILQHMYDKGCRSITDIGCGPGGMLKLAKEIGYEKVCGIDGDTKIKWVPLSGVSFIYHDFETGTLDTEETDIVWSCEFVEHVKPEYIPNFLPLFNRATKNIIMTFCPPQRKGNKFHFNEQPKEYWLGCFKEIGWEEDVELRNTLLGVSTMKREFFRKNGIVFKRC